MTNSTKANHTKTLEAHYAYRANREEAGRVIDIETCEYAFLYLNMLDPYGTLPDDENEPYYGGCSAQSVVVRSDESDGWIYQDNLPEEKWRALNRRIEREQRPLVRKYKLWEAACAAHPMYEFDTELVACLVWKGDGEEPSRDALIEWFKVNHPAQASEVEREMVHHDLGVPLP